MKRSQINRSIATAAKAFDQAGLHLPPFAFWTPGQWADTWPGEDDDPAIITRQWVIWHLLEHDLHHGGEISLTLGANGIQALQL